MNMSAILSRFRPNLPEPTDTNMSSPGPTFTPINRKQSSSKPFTEDNGSEIETGEQSDIFTGNWVRKRPHESLRAPAARMNPRRDVFDIANVDDEGSPDMSDASGRQGSATSTSENVKERPRLLDSRSSPVRAPFTPKQPSKNKVRAQGVASVSRAAESQHQQMDHLQVTRAQGSRDSLSTNSRDGSPNGDTEMNEEVAIRAQEEETKDTTDTSDQNEEEAESGLSEGEFELESIQGHKYIKGNLTLEVKWKGYGPSDNTFEPEESLRENAAEMIDVYFQKIGGRPQPVGRPRKKPMPAVVTVRPRKPIRAPLPTFDDDDDDDNDNESDDDLREYTLPTPRFDEEPPEFPPEPKQGSWEDLVDEISHLELTDEDACKVGIRWLVEGDDGVRYVTKEDYWAVKLAAPSKLFAYFEQSINFAGRDASGIPAHCLERPGTRSSGLMTGTSKQMRQKRAREVSQSSLPTRTKKSRR